MGRLDAQESFGHDNAAAGWFRCLRCALTARTYPPPRDGRQAFHINGGCLGAAWSTPPRQIDHLAHITVEVHELMLLGAC